MSNSYTEERRAFYNVEEMQYYENLSAFDLDFENYELRLLKALEEEKI